ncbi:metallophosphoesterase [Rossellomorea vietnamensis]|uniref:metallophosphoesterase n=1 Tax=Rossellomorea vietnamensis TaxID=218284 RepID=UPI00054DE213|nr:metallophosphoesterase [Rossellomorea vietnamensis]OXS57839.1 serine/threonine protein phosphatase [Bacillus sp. DSM 27956]PRX75156.1 protein phosphatase [Bacillus sp. V-88]SLK23849.1 protein phosphatase [Bacillus sp. V-88]
MKKIKRVILPNQGRVIVISDIHGELNLFIKLLHKVNFSSEDHLFINGDLCEKGSNSKGTVRYIMELAKINPNVHVTEGNCDTVIEDLLEENPKLMDYIRSRKHSILKEWLDEVGFELKEDTAVQEVKEILTRHFPHEIQWLMELPTAIETDDYIFVHAGLDDGEDWRETDRIAAITMSAFLEKSHRSGKYVIVGHWPVVNYSSDIPSNNPVVSEDKKIISIDGGNVIKSTGQLNAFIIHRTKNGDSFSQTYTDHHFTCEVVKGYISEPIMSGSISYPNYELIPLQPFEHFTLCKQVGTDDLLYVKNEYIYESEKGTYSAKTDLSCAQISVDIGDIISVVDSSCTGYDLIKKNGEEGWVPKDVFPVKQRLSNPVV